MTNLMKQLRETGIIPVIKIEDAKDASPLAEALTRGGLPCAEITFRTEAAGDAIRAMREAYPHMLIGAGTVLNRETVDAAVEAGASFIVSPGLNPDTVRYCQMKSVPVIPGVATAGEIETALSLGLDTVKFFPAEANGGAAALKALSGPFPQVRFIPTGGVNADNLRSYLDLPQVLACGGSWMAESGLIASGSFDRIEALTREAVERMLGFAFIHLGINCESAEEAGGIADALFSVFGLPKKDGPKSVFAGSSIEIMKYRDKGTRGHIGIRTDDIERAVAWLSSRGVAFDFENSVGYRDGKLNKIYIRQEIGGFAFHLLQK